METCGALLSLDREADGRRLLSVKKTRSGLPAAEQVAFRIGPQGIERIAEPKGETPIAEAECIGTEQNGKPLGKLLASKNRFGLSSGSEAMFSPMHVNVEAAGEAHPIFTGFNTALPIDFEENGNGLWDEQYYSLDANDPNAPADWTVLATLGNNMNFAGEVAIVEFTTSNGTRIMLDGSANSFDGYLFWTQDRWDVLYNQVVYLMGL